MASGYQAVITTPVCSIGVRCSEDEIVGIDFLPVCPEQSPAGALATEAVRQLREYLRDPDAVFSLPLRPAGTAYQRRVWQSIATIPGRQTRTYGDLAKQLCSGPRAVGQACGANPYPVVVPCHRVVAAAGGLGGFGRQGGDFLLDIKRWLLAHEHGRADA